MASNVTQGFLSVNRLQNTNFLSLVLLGRADISVFILPFVLCSFTNLYRTEGLWIKLLPKFFFVRFKDNMLYFILNLPKSCWIFDDGRYVCWVYKWSNYKLLLFTLRKILSPMKGKRGQLRANTQYIRHPNVPQIWPTIHKKQTWKACITCS